MPICFKTDSELDTRSLTEMGLNAKPNTSSPIGMFGTGLKYTVATLVRLRIPFKMFIGTTEYEFYEKVDDFRGQTYHPLYMRKRKLLSKWYSVKLPYNTNYGRNWELWMVYRELHANTLDEKGLIFESNEALVENNVEAGKTLIVVYGKEFWEVWNKREEIFLPWASYDTGLDHTGRPALLEFRSTPSKHVYYRGLRVYTADKPYKYTYNILSHLYLTEDRTAPYWGIMSVLVEFYTSRCNDPNVIQSVLEVGDKFQERSLDWDYGASEMPSEAFTEVVKRNRGSYGHLTGFTTRTLHWYGDDTSKTLKCPDDVWDTVMEVLEDKLSPELRTEVTRELCNKFGRTLSTEADVLGSTPAKVAADDTDSDIPF